MDAVVIPRRVALLAAVLAVAGCGGTGASASHSTGPTTPGSPGENPATSPAEPPDEVPTGKLLVSYGRQGGFAGFNDQLLINTDGSYEITRIKPKVNKHGHLSAGDLSHLRSVLNSAGFSKLPAVQPAKGNDLYTYQVIYNHHQVVAQDGGMVPAMKTVVAELSHLLATYS